MTTLVTLPISLVKQTIEHLQIGLAVFRSARPVLSKLRQVARAASGLTPDAVGVEPSMLALISLQTALPRATWCHLAPHVRIPAEACIAPVILCQSLAEQAVEQMKLTATAYKAARDVRDELQQALRFAPAVGQDDGAQRATAAVISLRQAIPEDAWGQLPASVRHSVNSIMRGPIPSGWAWLALKPHYDDVSQYVLDMRRYEQPDELMVASYAGQGAQLSWRPLSSIQRSESPISGATGDYAEPELIPPLLIHKEAIVDGEHRYEALIQNGFTHWWAYSIEGLAIPF